MANNKHTGRDIIGKLAIPVILVLSLLTARLMVEHRSAIILSAPVELRRCGLSVSMPSGNGWESSGEWIYGDDRFIITSSLSIDPISRSYVQCQYLLAGDSETATQQLDEHASELEGQIVETGQLRTNQVMVEWARIQRTVPGTFEGLPGEAQAKSRFDFQNLSDVVLGICKLPAGRQLEIEVFSQEENNVSWEVFERIVKTVRFSDDGLLQAGAGLISEARKIGLTDILSQSPSSGLPGEAQAKSGRLSSLLLILNPRGLPIGFTFDVIMTQGENLPAVKAANYYYRRDLIPYEQIGRFRGDDGFEQFTWNVETSSRAGREGIEMTGNNGLLRIRFSAGRRSGAENEYALAKAAIPDIVLEPVMKNFRDSPLQEIIVDVIRSDGTVTPVYIEKINPAVKGQSYIWALRLEVLDGRDYWQQVYYDGDGPPAKIIFSQEGTYTFQRATPEQIARAFPEQADLVLNQYRLLEHND
ncbi:MAG: hypothetical protein JW749_12620 [Sedimentisphaerales bacterium]|nr:hypothetical protein [Sedimentisphaerales bacterium]